MKRRLLTLLCVVSLAPLGLSPIFAADPPARTGGTEVVPQLFAWGMPALTDVDTAALGPYLNTRSASFRDWQLDGAGMLVATRFAETAQLHRVAAPGGSRHQLTFLDEPVREARPATWRGRTGIFYTRDVGGAEGYQVFFLDAGTGRDQQLTTAPSRNMSLQLTHDRSRLAFASTMRNQKDYDIYVMDLATDAAPRKVWEGAGYWAPSAWSPDNKALVLLNYISSTEASVHHLRVADGALTPVAPNPTQMTYTAMGQFSHDGKGIYLVSNRWDEVRELGYWDLAAQRLDRLTPDVPWDIESVAVDPTGHCIAFSANRGGQSALTVWRLPNRRPVAIPNLPVGLIRSLDFDAAGKRLAFAFSGPKTAGDVYSLDFGVSGGSVALTQWTESEVGGLDTTQFIAPEMIAYPTFDQVDGKQRQVPAFYFKPRGAGPHPVIIAIHGGPESQWRPRFSALYQHWVRDLGLAIIAPNVRGSAGYGKSYLLLDNGFKREDSVKDIGTLLDWIAAQPELDAARVAVFGGSYGGYMVLASLARFADRLAAGAEIVGISNFVTFLKNTKEYRRDLRRAEYGDERDPKMNAHLQAISPTTLVKDIKDPLFVAQGANDPRVPASESEQIVDAVKASGVATWYLLAMDEGHGFRKKKNRDYYLAALTRFWRNSCGHLNNSEPLRGDPKRERPLDIAGLRGESSAAGR